MKAFSNQYHGRRVLVTGHTGFKGNWLTLWLTQLGATVIGASNSRSERGDPICTPAEHFMGDLRDAHHTGECVRQAAPDIVFHLAAQSLVRASYDDPLTTWSTNVMATANILDACRHSSSVRAVVVVTSDKCYENREWLWGYRETDRLGGHDPYSASKAAAEMLTTSYRRSYFSAGTGQLLATVRGGNVIGGGDWARDRLIPDAVRAAIDNQELVVRFPDARRPWQHVLDCLSGYLAVGQSLLAGNVDHADSFNFGPVQADNWRVREVLDAMALHWPVIRWRTAVNDAPHEASLLYLDTAKASSQLAWRPVWSLSKALAATTEWYREYATSGSDIGSQQLDAYVANARGANLAWACG